MDVKRSSGNGGDTFQKDETEQAIPFPFGQLFYAMHAGHFLFSRQIIVHNLQIIRTRSKWTS
jgi:hypothetical protein